MKRVFGTAAEVAHLFAHQAQDDARCRNASFNGLRFKSYSTVVAMMHPREGKPTLTLFSASRYSMTTDKQLSQLSSALRGVTEVMYVTEVDVTYEYDHKQNRDWFLKKSIEVELKSRRARSNKDRLIAESNSYLASMRKYADYFDLVWEIPESITQAADVQLSILQSDLRAEKLREIERIEKQAEDLDKWMADPQFYYHGRFEELRLRVKDDEIQTTHGARIPLEDAKKYWPLLRRLHEAGRPYVPTNVEVKFGYYAMSYFKNDILKVGCHEIPYSEIKRIAVQLGLFSNELLHEAA
jgi:hypothetical protein